MLQPYIPIKLPLTGIDYESIITLIVSANTKVAEYNTFIQTIPNPQILLSTLTTNEAVVSSRIEGTQATLEEVVEAGENLDEKNAKFADIQEVMNYRKSLIHAVKKLEEYPLSLPFMKDIHSILLNGVRGQDKSRGMFRDRQNWIGPKNTPIEEATYIPPIVPIMNESLGDLEKYIHFKDKDTIVQSAIIHAQFELIHPFLDGNGRIGRLLIPLFLYNKQLLAYPSFYMSEYFNTNRDEYYAKLKAISAQGDWNGWIVFFLNAVISQAKTNLATIKKIRSLYEELLNSVQELTHSQYFVSIVDSLFTKPVFSTKDFIDYTKTKPVSAYSYLKRLEEKGIISGNDKQRNRIYYFDALLDIIK